MESCVTGDMPEGEDREILPDGSVIFVTTAEQAAEMIAQNPPEYGELPYDLDQPVSLIPAHRGDMRTPTRRAPKRKRRNQ
jgi:hypothetical protein